MDVTEAFERQRPQLRAVAYRMLGSLAEADDAVQEAWLRLHRTDTAAVDNLGRAEAAAAGRGGQADDLAREALS